MAVLRSPAVVVDAETAALLRRWGVRGLLEAAARANGQRLPVELRALLDEVDEVAVGHVGRIGRPTKGRRRMLAEPITSGEATKVLQVSERQITRLAKAGDLVGRKHHGKWQIDERSAHELAALRGVDKGA